MIGLQIPTVLDVLVSGCDFMVHYGHSCLIPVDRTQGIKMLYVFVDIKIDSLHFVETLKHNFDKGNSVILLRYFFFIQRGFFCFFVYFNSRHIGLISLTSETGNPASG